MSYGSSDKVFYCKECGEINSDCNYISSVSEWGTASLGRYGLDHESSDSETQDTYYKCCECDHEWSARGEFQEAQMTYADALMAKYNDFGNGEFTEDEQEDFDEIHGEFTEDEQEDFDEIHGEQEEEPREPREGRNTLKCPEEVTSDSE